MHDLFDFGEVSDNWTTKLQALVLILTNIITFFVHSQLAPNRYCGVT